MIKTLVPQIVKALREISDWPWGFRDISIPKTDDGLGFVSDLNGIDFSHHGTNRKTKVQNVTDGKFIAASPLWLAQMVVGMVEERAELRYPWCDHFEQALYHALRDFSLTESDWKWLKGIAQAIRELEK